MAFPMMDRSSRLNFPPLANLAALPYAALPPLADCLIVSSSLSFPIPVLESRLCAASSTLAELCNSENFKETRFLHFEPKSEVSEPTIRKFFEFISTGRMDLAGCSVQEMKQLANEYQIQKLLDALQKQQISEPVTMVPTVVPTPIYPNPVTVLNALIQQQAAQQQQYQALQQFFQFQLLSNSLNLPTATATPVALEPIPEERVAKKRRAGPDGRELKKSNSLETAAASSDETMLFNNRGDVIIPSSEKEGWCRNKKYIEKTEQGFMCTVCRKVYGRYNSVSYHVTIYHRNPPIRCGMAGCQFTTREARYIHFHKYYRHQVPLPQSIDQGSRKCPHCAHVAKSPAMLEKHIKRHLTNDVKDEMSDSASTSDFIVVDESDVQQTRDRTVSECLTLSPPMDYIEEEEMPEEESIEVKPRALTM